MSALKSTDAVGASLVGALKKTESTNTVGAVPACPTERVQITYNREQSTIIAYLSSWSAANQRSTPEGAKVKDLNNSDI